jgi:CheY-like chemotaxis protein
MSEMLDSMGYNVTCCNNGAEAVNVYNEMHKEIDFILLDLIMPKMSGLDCYRRLKEINPNVVVIVVSGYGGRKDLDQILNEGANAIIEKPFELSELAKAIAERTRK